MFEVSVAVHAPDLSGAINALAAAMQGAKVASPAPISPPGAAPLPVQLPVTPAAAMPPPVMPPTPPIIPPAQLTILPAAPIVPPAAASPIAPSLPVTQAPAYTHEQLMTAGATLIDAGKINGLMALLGAFGVGAVTQLKPEMLGAFATEMRKLGAQI